MVKKLFVLLIGCFILISCAGCSDAEIYAFTVNSLSETPICVGMTSDELTVDVDYFRSFQTSDINVVIADNSIINIDFIAKESILSGYYISYTITGLDIGTTSFYFETSDHTVKSEEVNVEIVHNIKSIDFNDTSDIYLSEYLVDDTRYFDISAYDSFSNNEDMFECISEDSNVATIEYKESYVSHCCTINRVGAGETYIYIQTKDGIIRSEKIRVVSAADEPETPTVGETQDTIVSESEDDGIEVYVTPTGKKYHYSSSCAGKNAIPINLSNAQYSYDPCKKCAQ